MVQTNRHLDEALKELPRWTVRVKPQLLPHFVGLKERTTIKVLDALQVPRIVLLGHIGSALAPRQHGLWRNEKPTFRGALAKRKPTILNRGS